MSVMLDTRTASEVDPAVVAAYTRPSARNAFWTLAIVPPGLTPTGIALDPRTGTEVAPAVFYGVARPSAPQRCFVSDQLGTGT